MERATTDCHIETVCIDEELVTKKLLGLKTEKSPGPDELYPRILKEAAIEIAYYTQCVKFSKPRWKMGNYRKYGK